MPARRKKKEPRKAVRPEPIPPGATRQASDHDLRPGESVPRSPQDADAVGTPGGGSEVGGLAGTNFGDGDPENSDLGATMEPGDLGPDSAVEGPPYSGQHGGAVGGSPAEGRASGGHIQHGLRPGGNPPADSTIGTDPDESEPRND
jgi:hypothetical protein